MNAAYLTDLHEHHLRLGFRSGNCANCCRHGHTADPRDDRPAWVRRQVRPDLPRVATKELTR